MPTFSIVILTCNRYAMLRDCLKALADQTRRADEILVVQNGPEGVEALEKALADVDIKNLRVIPGIPEGGWAASRNRGVDEAQGDWVVFTDDDCLPEKDWLERIAAWAEQGVDTVGGITLPAETLPRPWWWHPEMGWTVGLSVPGQQSEHAGSWYYAQTANWASRREVLLREPFQQIPQALKKGIANYGGGREDTELWRRLRQKGYRVAFDGRLRVLHRVPADRIQLRNVLRRAWLDGVALQRRQPSWDLVDIGLSRLLDGGGDYLGKIWQGPESPPREAMWRLVWAAREWGQCAGFCERQGWLQGMARLGFHFSKLLMGRFEGAGKTLARKTLARPRHLRPEVWGKSRRPRRVLVAACGFLGDTTLLHPFLSGLKQQHPEKEIALLTNFYGEQLYRLDPHLAHLWTLPEGESPKKQKSFIRSKLNAFRPHLILIPYLYGVSPAPFFHWGKAPVIGFREEMGFPRKSAYDRLHKALAKPHGRPESENLYRLFQEAGFEGNLAFSPLAFSSEESDRALDFLREKGLAGSKLAVIAPGSAKSEKWWSLERWAQVLQYLHDTYQMQLMLTGAPNEEEACREIARLSERQVVLETASDIRLKALLLSEAALFVGSDNGIKHLAVAMETPTLCLFGPTDERQWGPNRDTWKHGAVRSCTFDLTFEERIGLAENHQMLCIKVDHVKKALDAMLWEGGS